MCNATITVPPPCRDSQIDSRMDKDYHMKGLKRWQNGMLFDVAVEAEDVGGRCEFSGV